MDNDQLNIIRPSKEIVDKINKYIRENKLEQSRREIEYHFNIGEWHVNLSNTKKSMINYDFVDLVSTFQVKTFKEDGETNKDYRERQRNATETLQTNFIKLYKDFRSYIIQQLTPIVKEMDYNDLFELFDYTWGRAPFKLNYLLEDMFLFFGDQSIMQNVVGPSGSGKSTRTMIEFNSLPSVLRVDDATVAGISRDSQTKGSYYFDDTVVYYNDVGDSTQMQANFRDCLQTIYKKLFSEGAVSRAIAMKNSDKTLRLDLKTPNGFKLKFNSVKPIFNEDDGQTAARTMTISLPSITSDESEEMLRTGRFGKATWTRKDPRIFKDVLQVYYLTREFEEFTGEYKAELAHRYNEDHDGEVNWHGISNIIYVHEEMSKLYGMELYKKKYYNRVMINTSVSDLESELYDIIKNNLVSRTFMASDAIPTRPDLNDYKIAKTKTASAHIDKYAYEAFTVKAVKGIRRKFIEKNVTKISSLLKSMEEHDLCHKLSSLDGYNVYVLLEREDEECTDAENVSMHKN